MRTFTKAQGSHAGVAARQTSSPAPGDASRCSSVTCQRRQRSSAERTVEGQRQAPRRLLVRTEAAEEGSVAANAVAAVAPIPTRLNTIPHERTTRQHFYRETTAGVMKALAAGEKRLIARFVPPSQVCEAGRCVFPEVNTEFDVYRIGTLLELVREVASTLAGDGKRVKVCVQQALGQGVFQGMPLSLNGVMRIMKQMDWGANADLIQTGNLGAAEVESADAFVLISPQNIVGHSVMPLLSEMSEAAAAAGKPLVLINPKLVDIQSAAGVMSVRGRQDRMNFAASFPTAYHFRLLYKGVTMHPIMGAMRHEYGGPWEVFRRVELGPGQEEYQLICSFEQEPTPPLITDAFKAAWAKAAAAS